MKDRQRVVLATTNSGKVRELAEPLAAAGVDVVGLDAFPELGDIVEDGDSFEANALIKARAVARHTGLVSIADDSGLEVDALHGAPGIHSARYADDWAFLAGESRDDRNIRKLLSVMRDVAEAERGCRFVCCMAVVLPPASGGREWVVRGVWEGSLLTACRGGNGFGYDPIFLDPELGRSAAELERGEKTARSHRGRALRRLLAGWTDFLNPGPALSRAGGLMASARACAVSDAPK